MVCEQNSPLPAVLKDAGESRTQRTKPMSRRSVRVRARCAQLRHRTRRETSPLLVAAPSNARDNSISRKANLSPRSAASPASYGRTVIQAPSDPPVPPARSHSSSLLSQSPLPADSKPTSQSPHVLLVPLDRGVSYRWPRAVQGESFERLTAHGTRPGSHRWLTFWPVHTFRVGPQPCATTHAQGHRPDRMDPRTSRRCGVCSTPSAGLDAERAVTLPRVSTQR